MAPGQNHHVEVAGALEGVTVADAMRFVSAGVSAPGIHYVHTDHLGSPQKMTDANQTIVWDAVFTPFGQMHSITGTATNNQRFPGQYFDQETGYHYNYFRDYDPTTGRYVQSDPIGLEYSLNTYSFVDANPIRWIDLNVLFKLPADPSGLSGDWQLDPSHQNPNGSKYTHPNGDSLEFHKGRQGEGKWKQKDHWHHNGDKKHLEPGDEVPDPEDNSDSSKFCEVAQQAILGAGGAYAGYRILRLLSSSSTLVDTSSQFGNTIEEIF